MKLLHPSMWHNHDIDFARWLHPAMWHSFGIMTVNSRSGSTLQCDTCIWDDMPLDSPGGSTLQCDRWLWDDMPWNSPKYPPHWNSTSGFDFDHITAVDMLFCTSLRNFIQIWPPSAQKVTSCWFSRWQISAILDFRCPIMGSLKSPCTISYKSSLYTIAQNCLVSEKIVFFCILATDRQTPPMH